MPDGFPSLSGILSDIGTNTNSSTLAFGGTRVSDNREDAFDRESGRFHDPETGRFEPGGAPPDLDGSVDRYRAEDGSFKESPQDLYDERAEVMADSLQPRG